MDFYSDNFQKSKISKIELIKNIQTFIPTLEDFEISTTAIPNKTIIICRLKDIDDILPLSMFGDGTVKLFRMLAEISNCSNSRLMIDEIDSGIHWSRYKDYWKTIIKAAANNNVQIFATTHSWECLKYLKEVLEEEDMKQYQGKTRSYTLVKQPNSDHVKAFKYSFPEFEFALERDIEIRGER